ncbi:Crp/Fnr family transcriptional regulator [Muriicola sp. Z0-33]|uniref:Crp/Fnr family transcriptional regulator n=1 Tax=Muriicola sp. Z0-33 TaxID=2816957 RepID=UPI0022371D66|nr:Crp/Fnr family transcriptional regulator [Muriicola sp. Z0-33]MCW5516935.1 Crp/Fnr family transcriptional regulator [Muriicola sp. Z0-33]
MNFKNLNGLVPLDLISEIFALMEKFNFPKNHILHHQGTICNHIYLIEKGLARTFFHKEDKEITVHFASEGELITAIDSVISLKKSKYNVQLLEDSEIYVISYSQLQSLLVEHPKYEKYMRLILEQLYAEGANRIEEFLFYSAKERYNNFLNRKPSIVNRINLGHLASYLAMTQETMSRIRRQI